MSVRIFYNVKYKQPNNKFVYCEKRQKRQLLCDYLCYKNIIIIFQAHYKELKKKDFIVQKNKENKINLILFINFT